MKGFLLEVVTIPKATRWTEVAGRIQSGLWPTADLNGLTSLEVSGQGPACVKTCASRECAELFSPFSSFDCDCQCCSFPIQRNRDKLSTRKFDVGVFAQAGS
jgi:hypothetical protein